MTSHSDPSSHSTQDVKGASVSSEKEPVHEGLGTKELIDRIKGVIYGNCIGDAIGLLTEFMTKKEAQMCYDTKGLEYDQKHLDEHRRHWEIGDWTDDSDQMILILRTLLKHDGQFDEKDFAKRLYHWAHKGYPELGDHGGCGLGRTIRTVMKNIHFLTDPHQAAQDVWECTGRVLAPNGAVMRTSILGTMKFNDVEKVIANAESACRVTHADPRCIASCIAVTMAIALMLQGKCMMNNGECDVDAITKLAYEYAEKVVDDEGHKQELKEYIFERSLEKIKLDEPSSIGYTLKCLGAGFWAFRQKDFREAIEKITMEAGDADTNCAVAGALLGCKVGFSKLPKSWVNGLLHRKWLDTHIENYLILLGLTSSES